MPNQMLTGELQTFDEEKRELYVKILPWDVEVSTQRGVESFSKGFFEGVDPGRIVSRVRHQDPPTGRAIELEEKDDGAYARLRIARTAAGDEQLTLAREGIETGVSLGFEDGEHEKQQRPDGRMQWLHKRVNEKGVLEISTTYKPAYGAESQVIQVFERKDMAEATEQPTEPQQMVTAEQLQKFEEAILTRVEQLSEQQAAMRVEAPSSESPNLERRIEIQVREVAEVIIAGSPGNSGVTPIVPKQSEIIGKVDGSRPFLATTKQITAPEAGTTLRFPKITQHPTVAKQTAEKDELSSQATIIGVVDFAMETYGGVGDLSMQLIKRSSPSFLELWLELLGAQYGINTDNAAVDNLLAVAAVVEGGELDPESPSFGSAFTNTAAATGGLLRPNRIWLSTAAVAAFMDAKEPTGGGGRPLYPGIANISGLGGSTDFPGAITLQPVHVPALDDEAVDVIVGPSEGFVWAEDGTYNLQADVPSKFGRDVGLAGMVWFGAIYPAAFTTYTLPS